MIVITTISSSKLIYGIVVGIAICILIVIVVIFRMPPLSQTIKTPEDAFKLFVECYNTQNFNQMSKISAHPDELAEKIRKKFAPMFQAIGPLNNVTILDKMVDNSVSVIEFSADTKIGHIVWYCIFVRSKGKWNLYSILSSKEVALKMAEPLKAHEASIIALEEYVRKNYRKITLDANDLSDFSILEPIALNYSVILFGEGQHHTQELRDLFYKLVVFLNKYGYRDIILEAPSSLTYYFNSYLTTGSEEYYQFINDEGGLWKRIYEYNKDLPKEKKIRVWCVDVDPNSELYEPKITGNEQNPMYAIKKWREARENEIKKRFVDVYEKLPEGAKVLGYFGAWHVDKMPRKIGIEEWDEIETIGYFLAHKYKRTKGKVYSIMTVSYKGEYYEARNLDTNAKKMRLGRAEGSLEEIFNTASDDSLWFLDISVGENPFSKYSYLSRSNRAWDQPPYNGMNGWVNQSKYDGFFFVREIHCVERTN